MSLTAVSLLGWIILACGVLCMLLGFWQRLPKSNPIGFDATVVAKRIGSDTERALCLKLKNAVPDYFVLMNVPFSHFLRLPSSDRQNRKDLAQFVAPALICQRDGIALAVFARADDTKCGPGAPARMQRLLEAAGIALISMDHVALPTTHLRDAIQALERKALTRGIKAKTAANAASSSRGLDGRFHADKTHPMRTAN